MGGPYDILAVGYACIDYIAVVDRLPELDEKLIVDNLLIQGGGPAGTAMVAAARLGLRTGLIAALCRDPLGKQIIDELERERVDVSLAPIHDQGRAAFAFVMIQKGTGLRTLVGRRSYLPLLTPDDVRLGEVRRAKALLIDGNEPEAQLAAARTARKAGVPVIFDAGNEKPGMKELIPFTDILVASRGFGRDVGGSDDPATAAEHFFRSGCLQVAAVTAGADGAYFCSGEGAFHQPAFAIDAADTTGAGDAFHGGYAYAMVHEWPVRKAARFAAAVAAIKCTKIGGRTGLPCLREVEEFLAENT